MRICLNGDKDLFKITRYRNNIQDGIEELEKILLQISYIYKEEVKGDELSLMEFDLNWLVNDICVNISAIAQKRSQSIIFNNRSQSVHVKSDMIVLKLLLYNLLISVIKVAEKEEKIRLEVNRNKNMAVLNIRVNKIVRPLADVMDPFIGSANLAEKNETESATRYGEQAISFLKGSIQTDKYKETGVEILFNLPLETS